MVKKIVANFTAKEGIQVTGSVTVQDMGEETKTERSLSPVDRNEIKRQKNQMNPPCGQECPANLSEQPEHAGETAGVKAIISGSACVVFSSLTLEEIKELKRNHPEMLVLKDDAGQAALTLDVEDQTAGKIDEYSVIFGPAVSREGKATITLLIDPKEDDTMGMIREEIGDALMKLSELENKIAVFLGKRSAADEPMQSEIIWL